MQNRTLFALRGVTAIGLAMVWLLASSQLLASAQCPGDDLPPECGIHEYCSPIIVDIDGHGFRLTDAKGGVIFDIAGNNHPIQMAWTAPSGGNAFLAIDLNHNGKIDSGKELFGNFSPQPLSKEPNGFVALAKYDTPAFGGNGDGIIDTRDSVFQSLLLWIDKNHDGVSQPEELYTLPQLGVTSVSLSYRESRRVDEFGNELRFKGTVNVKGGGSSQPDHVDHTIYDVFFTTFSGGAMQ
jgi:hypothetical protein